MKDIYQAAVRNALVFPVIKAELKATVIYDERGYNGTIRQFA